MSCMKEFREDDVPCQISVEAAMMMLSHEALTRLIVCTVETRSALWSVSGSELIFNHGRDIYHNDTDCVN